MRREKGFTLIELMIVIAIIAIIAAIAIPGLLSSQRASNERNASASLKTLASAEADFRGNDRDGNKVQDFWVGDVCQLFGMHPIGSAEAIKLIDVSVAGANSVTVAAAGGAATQSSLCPITLYTTPSAKAGYWYRALINDENVQPYVQNTGGNPNPAGAANQYNTSKFGFLAFPSSRSAGRNLFNINEGNTIFKRGVQQTYAPVLAAGRPAANEPLTAQVVGASAILNYPTDVQLQADWAKMD
jgi:prepilin-type N-terminal cleavage/methylation domain-containing protein